MITTGAISLCVLFEIAGKHAGPSLPQLMVNMQDYFVADGGDSPALAARRGISPKTQQAIAKWLAEN
jgi:hypothetical protein